jgi:hypothetical protein
MFAGFTRAGSPSLSGRPWAFTSLLPFDVVRGRWPQDASESEVSSPSDRLPARSAYTSRFAGLPNRG